MLGLGAAPLGAQSGNAPFLANFNFTPSDATKAEAARIDAEERARRETAERQEYVPPPERQEYVPPADDGRREYAPPQRPGTSRGRPASAGVQRPASAAATPAEGAPPAAQQVFYGQQPAARRPRPKSAARTRRVDLHGGVAFASVATASATAASPPGGRAAAAAAAEPYYYDKFKESPPPQRARPASAVGVRGERGGVVLASNAASYEAGRRAVEQRVPPRVGGMGGAPPAALRQQRARPASAAAARPASAGSSRYAAHLEKSPYADLLALSASGGLGGSGGGLSGVSVGTMRRRRPKHPKWERHMPGGWNDDVNLGATTRPAHTLMPHAHGRPSSAPAQRSPSRSPGGAALDLALRTVSPTVRRSAAAGGGGDDGRVTYQPAAAAASPQRPSSRRPASAPRDRGSADAAGLLTAPPARSPHQKVRPASALTRQPAAAARGGAAVDTSRGGRPLSASTTVYRHRPESAPLSRTDGREVLENTATMGAANRAPPRSHFVDEMAVLFQEKLSFEDQLRREMPGVPEGGDGDGGEEGDGAAASLEGAPAGALPCEQLRRLLLHQQKAIEAQTPAGWRVGSQRLHLLVNLLEEVDAAHLRDVHTVTVLTAEQFAQLARTAEREFHARLALRDERRGGLRVVALASAAEFDRGFSALQTHVRDAWKALTPPLPEAELSRLIAPFAVVNATSALQLASLGVALTRQAQRGRAAHAAVRQRETLVANLRALCGRVPAEEADLKPALRSALATELRSLLALVRQARAAARPPARPSPPQPSPSQPSPHPSARAGDGARG